MDPIRIPATQVLPGHTVFLRYGRDLLVDVDQVFAEHTDTHPVPGDCRGTVIRLVGAVRYPQCDTAHDYTATSRHRTTTRLTVVADRNEPIGHRDGWNDLTRIVRHYDRDRRMHMVWTLDNDEPIGHGGRFVGTIFRVPHDGGAWWWHVDCGRGGRQIGNYIDVEASLLAAGVERDGSR
jgi:hypothetical protein